MKLNHIIKLTKYSIAAMTLLFSSFMSAIEVTDLYQARISVTSQASGDRNKALQQAMQLVFVKVGGQESILSNKILRQAQRKVSQYVTQYRYERKNEKLYLVAAFDENKINQLFQKANLSLWGSLRPQVLIWLVTENKFERNILSESDNSIFPTMIEDFSSTRGLPITLPLMDLQDSLEVNIADLWGRFVDPVQLVSSRYLVDDVVVLRLSNSSLLPTIDTTECETLLCQENSYVLDWTFVTEEKPLSKSYYGNNQEELLGLALKDISNHIYQQYALSTEITNEFILDVANVNSLSTLVDLNDFLVNLSAVESVKLVSATGTVRRFKLTLLGSKKALMASLKLNKQLQQIIDPLAEIDIKAVPVFNWGK